MNVLLASVAIAGVVFALMLMLAMARHVAASRRELSDLGNELRAFESASVRMGQRLLDLGPGTPHAVAAARPETPMPSVPAVTPAHATKPPPVRVEPTPDALAALDTADLSETERRLLDRLRKY